jgi:hypothetical protein
MWSESKVWVRAASRRVQRREEIWLSVDLSGTVRVKDELAWWKILKGAGGVVGGWDKWGWWC